LAKFSTVHINLDNPDIHQKIYAIHAKFYKKNSAERSTPRPRPFEGH